MAREPIVAAQSGRTAPARRRARSSVVRRVPGSPRRSSEVLPEQRPAEPPAQQRPTLTWELVTDATGRTRPEARWV